MLCSCTDDATCEHIAGESPTLTTLGGEWAEVENGREEPMVAMLLPCGQ